MCRRTHHGQLSCEQLCHLGHTPMHVAFGQPAPAKWKFSCQACGEVNTAITKQPHFETNPARPPAPVTTGRFPTAD
eukprot:4995433-Prymnesium_polylepis.1